MSGAPVPPAVWGPPRWQWLHLEAVSYPDAPTRWQKATAFIRFGAFIRGLPCAECRRHAVAHVREHPLDLKSSEAYQAWTWKFHNAVNRRKKRPIFTAEAFRAAYADERAWAPLIRARYPTVSAS